MSIRIKLLLFLALGMVPSAARAADTPDFNREVRPILSQHCFKCHGPDESSRQGGFRLDQRESATAAADSGMTPLVPNKVEESELVRRIESTEEYEMMPPVEAKKPLSAEQKEILKRWIASGAKYAQHWAFVAPVAPPLPSVRNSAWPKNAIDHFILARLEEAGLEPSREADRYALVRRVYLDLIGLPPTPEEADAFVADASDDAYERLVDHLLASPQYGERWARRWLDLARYADTNGYEKDRPRSIWPYRDWVIKAINRDMPFDRFTIEQLAGDLLPQATLDQRIATGFHRNTMLNEEGGIDPLEFRFYSMTDRAATTGTVWLGLTVGCAQCHTHKFDPITHDEYYGFMAFLNNTDEPQIDIPLPEVVAKRKAIAARIARLEADLPNQFPPPTDVELASNAAGSDAASEHDRRSEHLERRFAAWLAEEQARAVRWTPLDPASAKSNMPLLTILDDASILATGDFTKRDVYELSYRAPAGKITALRIEALPDARLPNHGPGAVHYEGPLGDFFLSEITLTADGKPARFASADHSYAKNGIGRGEVSAALAIDGHPQSGWSIDGGQGRRHVAVFRLAEPIEAQSGLDIQLLFERHYSAGLGRFRISATSDPRGGEARVLPPEVESLLLEPTEALTSDDRERLLRQFLLSAPELKEAREAIDKLRARMPELPTTLVMSERPPENPRATYRHHRGEYLQPQEQIEPATPAFLHSLPADARRDRLSFARWLVDPRNPLAARVTMNRQWAAFFGRGIVRTTEDFGYQGDAPSHPQLLDWLAVEFVRQGWSMKKMHRLMVTSATYRQASTVRPELARRDPQNVLLGRAPSVRLEAELVRDAALKASGLLSDKVGGASVFPPQPAGVTTDAAYGKLDWQTSTGDDRYRRGLYTFSKRTAPYAMFTTFDAPSGEACVPRREISNTPLQALTLLNDTVFVEVAQALGALAAEAEGDARRRAERLFRSCLTRPPSGDDLSALVAFYEAQRRRLVSGELDARSIAGIKEGDAIERAAWTTVARAMLSLDEMVTKN